MTLPCDLLDTHVWPRVHELAYHQSMQYIRFSGVSFFEDLPDLLWSGTVIRGDEFPTVAPGWSERVTEFRNNLESTHASNDPLEDVFILFPRDDG